MLRTLRRCSWKAEASWSAKRLCTGAPIVDSEKQNPAAVFSHYSEAERTKILDTLNGQDDLLSYDISKVRATKLIAHKKRNGALQQLHDILLIEGFSLKVVDKFYRSLLAEPIAKSAKTNRVRTAPFITPSLEEEQRQTIRSCVSVRIGVSSATWSRLELPASSETNQPSLLTHWQHHDIVEKKLHLSDLVQRCLYVDHLLPAADCYLFENPKMAQINSNPGSVDQQNINIQKAQIIAMLSYALAARQHDSNEETETKTKKRSCVFYLRRFLAARLFNHVVGTERVSSEESVMQLMRTHYNTEEIEEHLHEDQDEAIIQVDDSGLNIRRNVQFPQDLRRMFSSAGRYQREFLGQTLLLNLAFMRLVLLQDQDSLALVSRNPNKHVTQDENVA